MSPGDRPDLPLAIEPAIVLRAAAIGAPAPGPVQPVDHQLGLEEEPALRFEPLGPSARQDDRVRPPQRDADPAGPARDPDRTLPTTGPRLPALTAVGAIGLSWFLRRRGATRAALSSSRVPMDAGHR